jgi:hypothetical protein
MDRYFGYHFWQTLEMAWSRMETEVREYGVLVVVALVAIALLLWRFLSPGIKNK